MNIFNFAMNMELDGKAHYEKLVAETPVAGLKKIFSILAADEQKHYEVVESMNAGVAMEMADSTALEDAKNIFQTLQIGKQHIQKLQTKLDAFRYAMMLEEESVRLYEDIARKENRKNNVVVVQLLLRIIEEEKKHYNIVENIHYLIAKYENFISWQEFERFKEP